MKPLSYVIGLVIGSFVFALLAPAAYADPVPKKYRANIRKGLEWLAKQQHKDGHFSAQGDNYKAPMTALAGMAFLMEGSTIRTGKYSKNIRMAADWLMAHTQRGGGRDGLITDPGESSRYMYGHGFGLMFLASVYGDEDDKERRAKLKDILERAVKYCVNAQSTMGGWYYTSKMEGGDNDEGSVTVTQLQALRAARNAGIHVPKQAINMAAEYLQKSTTPKGGVIYRLNRGVAPAIGGERPALTAAALACAFSMGDYNSKFVQKWFKYCQTALPVGGGRRIGHDEYTQYYYAQAVYMLGDDGWEKLFGKTPKDQRVTWTQYRQEMFDFLASSQNADGSWTGGGGFSVGPVYATSIYLTIMQLDNGALPIYQR